MFDDFDMYETCEEYFGEDYNLWEEEQCFLDECYADEDFDPCEDEGFEEWCYEQEDAWLDGSYEE